MGPNFKLCRITDVLKDFLSLIFIILGKNSKSFRETKSIKDLKDSNIPFQVFESKFKFTRIVLWKAELEIS